MGVALPKDWVARESAVLPIGWTKRESKAGDSTPYDPKTVYYHDATTGVDTEEKPIIYFHKSEGERLVRPERFEGCANCTRPVAVKARRRLANQDRLTVSS